MSCPSRQSDISVTPVKPKKHSEPLAIRVQKNDISEPFMIYLI
jgi:hypothetical protein